MGRSRAQLLPLLLLLLPPLPTLVCGSRDLANEGSSAPVPAQLDATLQADVIPDDVSLSGSQRNDSATEEGPACSPGRLPSTQAQCQFVTSAAACQTDARLDYLGFYYCAGTPWRLAVLALLALWLAALFFSLGNTAADYFCPALEGLAQVLRLPPTVAGVALLPLGNGAPDVFASMASFLGPGGGKVGLSSVLGAAFFIVCVVGGNVCLAAARQPQPLKVDRLSALRDLSFSIIATLALLLIVILGSVNLAGAIAFFSLYPLYAASVACTELLRAASARAQQSKPRRDPAATPLLSLASQRFTQAALTVLLPPGTDGCDAYAEYDLRQWVWIRRLKPFQAQLAFRQSARLRLFGSEIDSTRASTLGHGLLPSEIRLPERQFPRFSSERSPGLLARSGSALRDAEAEAKAGTSAHGKTQQAGEGVPPHKQNADDERKGSATWADGAGEEDEDDLRWHTPSGFVEHFIKLPLTLPRMLTVPVHSTECWSQGWFVASASLAPLFALLVTAPAQASTFAIGMCAAAGALLGITAFATSTRDSPPSLLVPFWLGAGFAMSMLWFLLIANELVALLVAYGAIMGVDPGLLGLTVLAWGNSIADFMASAALVGTGTAARTQIAWSGCLAGPLFNILVGVGLSLVLRTWGSVPRAFLLPRDPSLPWLVACLGAALGLVAIGLRAGGMKLSRGLGLSLIAFYCVCMGLHILHHFLK